MKRYSLLVSAIVTIAALLMLAVTNWDKSDSASVQGDTISERALSVAQKVDNEKSGDFFSVTSGHITSRGLSALLVKQGRPVEIIKRGGPQDLEFSPLLTERTLWFTIMVTRSIMTLDLPVVVESEKFIDITIMTPQEQDQLFEAAADLLKLTAKYLTDDPRAFKYIVISVMYPSGYSEQSLTNFEELTDFAAQAPVLDEWKEFYVNRLARMQPFVVILVN
ncbi:MAG: hypothetical protein A2932_01075 [Candidatus Spechtbacteria bacterium RIFCSPLOWO2_01_FULL_46_10]|uniref:Uncharacterized protein n=1 Tax=Candidatus Spechtbacteria bacterium RIFCSPLOWO2_01_FULL_46_10 TaxID=1802163 RepID=A0A1G2HF08_9BACT|nr:MAG: hypothetical protein A2932_01075 [Candidatus Spechtbacteria bacterium RIFCSPLOWO2_01_FULL_46_10]